MTSNRFRSPGALGLAAIHLLLSTVFFLGLIAVGGFLSPYIIAAVVVAYLAMATAAVFFIARKPRRVRGAWRDVMPCYLSVQDRNLRIIETNELFRRDFGDAEGLLCYKVYKQREEPCPECPVLLTFQDGKNHNSRETVITLEGEEAEVVVTSAPRYDSRGKVAAVIEMSTNVTELRELERRLERSRADYKRLFDLSPCYITVQDRDLRILESNGLFEKDFEYRPGSFCYEAYKNRNEPCPGCVVEKTFEDGEPHISEEVAATKDGRLVNLMVYSMPIPNGNGGVGSVMEVSADITEVKRLESRLAVLGRAVADTSHRIKNILMGLQGGIFVHKEEMSEKGNEKPGEGWMAIEKNVGLVSNLISDILFCAKERKPVFKNNVSPEKVAEQIWDLYRESAAMDNIQLVLETPPEPHYRTLDPEGLHNLLGNIVANAIDACRSDDHPGNKEHTVTIRCGLDPGGLTIIEVSDDGAGMSKEIGRKIFTDFFTTKQSEGTGLGLVTAQKIAEEHGGAVSFISEPGKGSKFKVALPRIESVAE